MTPQEAVDYLRTATVPGANRCAEALGILQSAVDRLEEAPSLLSRRTREGLSAARARGVALGGFRGQVLDDKARRKGAETRKAQADEHALEVYTLASDLLTVPGATLRQTAETLDDRMIPTPSGRGAWSATAVQRVLRRLEALGKMEERDEWLD